ncbi:hypothetical protein QZM52_02370 [Burkholderia metallica]|uniref:Uncharacterized protein n=1 Tax=Burkholderia metallica TaxID=488729 RepID=A0ABT8P4X6_9BURK|nr:hypothetical protein [Burkholderia metallica]MDN7930131.1 hypothetical protein [Burkholderia metallica]
MFLWWAACRFVAMPVGEACAQTGRIAYAGMPRAGVPFGFDGRDDHHDGNASRRPTPMKGLRRDRLAADVAAAVDRDGQSGLGRDRFDPCEAVEPLFSVPQKSVVGPAAQLQGARKRTDRPAGSNLRA